MRAPEAALHGGLAHQCALLAVDAIQPLESAREHKMLVTGEDGVNALDAGEEQRCVLHPLRLVGVDAGVRQSDHNIGALLLHLRHPGGGRLDDVARHDVAGQVLGIPDHDLRRHEADEADADGMLGA